MNFYLSNCVADMCALMRSPNTHFTSNANEMCLEIVRWLEKEICKFMTRKCTNFYIFIKVKKAREVKTLKICARQLHNAVLLEILFNSLRCSSSMCLMFIDRRRLRVREST